MNSVAEAALGSWTFQPWPAFGLLVAAILYLRGWRRLRLLLPQRFTTLRAVSFLLSLVLIYTAMASPLDAFANLLLQVHMIQHLLFMMIIPPLLWMGIPFLPMLCGLPRSFVREAVGPLLIWPPIKKLGHTLTHPITCWTYFVLMNVFWHLPSLYELALHSTAWHQVEHLCFLSSALLFWWPIIQPWPSRPIWPRWTMIPYLLLADIQNTALGAFLSFCDHVLYPTYEAAPRLWGSTAIQDQAAAGAIMWVPGSLAFLIPIGIVAMQVNANKRGVRPSEFFAAKTQSKPQPPATSDDILNDLVRKNESFDLLKFPLLNSLIRSNLFRRTLQTVLLLLAILIVADGFFGPKVAPLNLAGVLPWTHWRGISVIALLAVGNLFCMACPFTFARDLARKILPANRTWPRALRSKWFAAVLIALYLWTYEVFGLWNSPWLTAWIIIGYFTVAILIDGFFKGASFCKYVCPIGQFNFVQSLISPFEVKVRSLDTCATCKTHDCIQGNAVQRGCELKLYQPRKSGNMDCTFCLDCIKACPHDNIGIIAGAPARDLFEEHRRSSVGRYANRVDLACLAALLVFGAFANAAGMVAAVVEWQTRIQEKFGLSHTSMVTLFLLATLLVIPAALLSVSTVISRIATLPNTDRKALFSDFVMGLIPLGATMWTAHFLFHLATGFVTPLAVFQRIATDLFGISIAIGQTGMGNFPALPAAEILLLDFGLLLSLYVLWRTARRYAASSQKQILICTPWAILAIALFLVGVWIVFQPMEMRGMLM
ncbi:MAG: cytochrome c oxidase assembly protein [Chthoniobacterales bacterium]